MLHGMRMKPLAAAVLMGLGAGCSGDSLAGSSSPEARSTPSVANVSETPSGNRWWVRTRPDAQDRTLDLMVHETACASGQPATGRIRPVVDYNAEDIIVTITVQNAEEFQTCPGNPDTPFTLRLSEPVGDRVIKDGRDSPPTAAQVTYPK